MDEQTYKKVKELVDAFIVFDNPDVMDRRCLRAFVEFVANGTEVGEEE